MAEVTLKNLKKVYPYQDEGKKKKKDGGKKTSLQITDEGVVAVQQFSLDIKDREFIVLVGPSGCGKSTTLRMSRRCHLLRFPEENARCVRTCSSRGSIHFSPRVSQR